VLTGRAGGGMYWGRLRLLSVCGLRDRGHTGRSQKGEASASP
jgi:hypothetical protein